MSNEPRESRYLSAVYWISPLFVWCSFPPTTYFAISRFFLWNRRRRGRQKRCKRMSVISSRAFKAPSRTQQTQRVMKRSCERKTLLNARRSERRRNCFPINLIASTPISLTLALYVRFSRTRGATQTDHESLSFSHFNGRFFGMKSHSMRILLIRQFGIINKSRRLGRQWVGGRKWECRWRLIGNWNEETLMHFGPSFRFFELQSSDSSNTILAAADALSSPSNWLNASIVHVADSKNSNFKASTNSTKSAVITQKSLRVSFIINWTAIDFSLVRLDSF